MSDRAKKFPIWVTVEEAELIGAFRDARNCANKKPFESETGAIREAARRAGIWRNGRAEPHLRPYCCQVCGKWHLTKRMGTPKHRRGEEN